MLYYAFWELSLVPMAILIAMYGRKHGPKAALKFFLFTFIPSAPLLVAILWLYAKTGSFDFVTLQILIAHGNFPAGAIYWASLAFLMAFAVKVPVFPLHGWLADTFSEAPVALAMVVAGKLGLYSCCASTSDFSLCRRGRQLPADRSCGHWGPLRRVSGPGAARLLALACLRRAEPPQPDHAGHLRLHVYRLDRRGLPDPQPRRRRRRAVLLLGFLYDRYATSQIADYGGVAARLPRTAALFVIASLAMIGLPMLNNFVGEFLILSSTFIGVSRGWAIAASLGVILGAAYMLWLVQRIFYGPESGLTKSKPAVDLQFKELAVPLPLTLLTLVMGRARSSGCHRSRRA